MTRKDNETIILPKTAVHRAVLDSVMEILQDPTIEMDDTLFQFGLTSLLAVRLAGVLSTKHSFSILSTAIMQQQTMGNIASFIQVQKLSTHKPLVRHTQPTGHANGFMLSYEQEQMWVLHQLDPQQSAAYAVPQILRLKGDLQVGGLMVALLVATETH